MFHFDWKERAVGYYTIATALIFTMREKKGWFYEESHQFSYYSKQSVWNIEGGRPFGV